MRRLFGVLALCVALAATPVFAQQSEETLSVALGEAVTLRVADNAIVVVSRSQEGVLSASEIAMIQHTMATTTAAETSGPNSVEVRHPDGKPDLPALEPDLVRVRFAQAPGGRDVVLLIENGYADAMHYSATQHVRGQASATDVCLVRPMLRGIEHWPYPIEQIDMAQIRFSPWREGDPVICR